MVALAVVILSFSFIASLGTAAHITSAENIPCEELQKIDSTPLPASSSIIFEALTGNLLSISF